MAADAGVRFAMTLTGFKWLARAARRRRPPIGLRGGARFRRRSRGRRQGRPLGRARARSPGRPTPRPRPDADGPTRRDRDSIRRALDLPTLAARRGARRACARSSTPCSHFATDRRRRWADSRSASTSTSRSATRDWCQLTACCSDSVTSGRVVVRPSGTEPKLKAYIEITPPSVETPLVEQRRVGAELVDAVRADLESLLRL